ncbi:MAG: short-chain dehydrogenase/reductase [Frankiales bacterium]|jgi:meso-butanediol dehydrogenase/(S,S)-butanediol dehydrogenase/diacetyl reductase|nr:short-chain dehydrogenase/reductase [Frankiales bacterium]
MSPARDLDGRVVLVTGASRGIGLATARAVADAGGTPVLVARDEDRLRKAAAEVGPSAVALPADVSDSGSVTRLLDAVDTRLGRLDAVVNNAAVAWPHRVEDVTDAQLAAEVGTNLVGPLLVIRAALPLLRRSGGGTIVNVSTESVRDPFPFLALYAATKAGLEVLTEGLARELRGEPVRVCLLVAGRTGGGGFTAHWPADVRREAEAAWDAQGYRARTSGTVAQPPERVAEAVLLMITQPPGSVVDHVSVRAHTGSLLPP